MESIWKKVRLPDVPHQQGDIHTDVLVVGGGMAGVLCGYFLTRAGVDNVVIEADQVAGGVTGCTTAKITAQHGLIYEKLAKRMGLEKVGVYLESQLAALDAYRQLCQGLDCDFQEKDAFVYSRNDSRKIEKELKILEKLGYEAEFVQDLPLPFPVVGAVKFPNQAQFHPLKFLSAILPGMTVYQHTKLRELAPGCAVTDRGTIRAEKIIIATHFPILNKHGAYFLKQYQARSYVLALSQGPNVEGMYLDEAPGGLSFRNAGDLLLLGGGGHRTGKQGGGWRELEASAGAYYPQARTAARWAAQDCMTLDGVPYIGPYSPRTPGLYVATGFGKWGMTSSMAAAMVLSDLVQGREHPWAALYDPARRPYLPQLAANGASAAINLLTPTRPRCPHMGCALKWNPQEHSWDCPCHGSRFGETGKLLDGPATDDRVLKGKSPDHFSGQGRENA